MQVEINAFEEVTRAKMDGLQPNGIGDELPPSKRYKPGSTAPYISSNLTHLPARAAATQAAARIREAARRAQRQHHQSTPTGSARLVAMNQQETGGIEPWQDADGTARTNQAAPTAALLAVNPEVLSRLSCSWSPQQAAQLLRLAAEKVDPLHPHIAYGQVNQHFLSGARLLALLTSTSASPAPLPAHLDLPRLLCPAPAELLLLRGRSHCRQQQHQPLAAGEVETAAAGTGSAGPGGGETQGQPGQGPWLVVHVRAAGGGGGG
ncbi:hypothetical protein Agub_g2749, partial [Astrephomene gubernaculifera]